MQLTKHGHSCIRFDDGDRSLVIDPGVFSEVGPALDGADGVLITHEHPDHLDVERLSLALRANSQLRVWAPESVRTLLADAGAQVVAVAAGETFTAGGFEVQAHGGQHALIHLSIPMVANLGYLVEPAGVAVYHPGDSLELPAADVQHLLLPTAAPWSKAAEVIDYALGVRAPRISPIHDAIVNDRYRGIVHAHLTRQAERVGLEFAPLAPGETIEA